jgi:hypothetical protein
VFNSKTKDLYNNLMHITLKEITTLIRTLELLSPSSYLEAESFYEDDSAIKAMQLSNLLLDTEQPRYH